MNTLRYWIQICEDETDPFVYHVTPAVNLPKIRRRGLQPRKPGPDGWPEYDEDEYRDEDDEDDEEALPPEAFEARVFVWDDLGVAKSYANGYSCETVILRIKSSDFSWESGRTDFQYLYTTTLIPPNKLEVLDKKGRWCALPRPRHSPSRVK